MRRRQADAAEPHLNYHPDEEALAGLLEDGAAPETVRLHVAHCPICTRHVAELRRMRRVLQVAAAHDAAPSRDVAGEALARVHLRQAAIGGLNELLNALATLLRGLAALLPSPRPRQGAAGTTHDPVQHEPAAAGGHHG